MDLDEILKATRTASADGGIRSDSWVYGKRRRDQDARTLWSVVREEDVALPEWNNDQITLPAAASSSTSAEKHTVTMSERQGIDMCHNIARWCVEYECGGRHNTTGFGSSKDHGDDDDNQEEEEIRKRAMQLSVECTTPTVVSLSKQLHHVFRGLRADATTTTSQLSPCVAPHSSLLRAEDVAPAVAQFRKSLHLLWDEVDLVGGLMSGDTPDLRKSKQRVVLMGLRGERPIATTTTTLASAAEDTEMSRRNHQQMSKNQQIQESLLALLSDD